MTDKLLVHFNKSLWFLLIYCITVILLIGLVYGRDVVDALVMFVKIYGIPLVAFLIFYVSFMGTTLFQRLIHQRPLPKVLLPVTIKIVIAILPMFLIDDRLASIFKYLNQR